MAYEDFLQRFGLIIRGDERLLPAVPDNKENEMIFDPLEALYQKQLELTPKRKSSTPKKKLRRRTGEIMHSFFSVFVVVFDVVVIIVVVEVVVEVVHVQLSSIHGSRRRSRSSTSSSVQLLNGSFPR